MKQPIREFKNTHYNLFGEWEAVIRIDGVIKRTTGFKTEKEAAIKVDVMLLENNKQPINILKRK